MQIKVEGINIQCMTGSIAAQHDIDAVVNPAGPQIGIGPGVSATLHGKAGPGLYEDSIALAPLQVGKAVHTSGHRLPNRYVIHCSVPFHLRGAYVPKQLAECYRNALIIAKQLQVESIAFPSLVMGDVGTPPQDSAQIALETVCKMVPYLQGIRTIRFVLFSRSVYQRYQQLLERQAGQALDRGLA